MTAEERHYYLIELLEGQGFDELVIDRFESECCLIIYHKGAPYTYTDKKGRRKTYRHAWQIVDWLNEKYRIPKDQIVFRN